MNNYMLVYRTKKLLVRFTSVRSNIYIIFSLANRVDPDQAALKRTAWSGSVLFAKDLKASLCRIVLTLCLLGNFGCFFVVC